MKLILAIVNNDDAHSVNAGLSKSGFFVTKISSTGGFLMNGNSTFLIGLNDEDVDHAIEIISRFSQKRIQSVPMDIGYTAPSYASSFPTEVTVGGATVFVLNVERYERL
ncbi:MAG: cyclic-di-AMP receptor [Firmicutes bacterium]|nr:cyclic-di-AMP receptor [Bacillota bacterium]